MLSSNSSSTFPTTATLSPRIKYSPCATSDDGSSSSGGLMIRSRVCASTCSYLSHCCNSSKCKLLSSKLLAIKGMGPKERKTYQICHLITAQQCPDQSPRVASQDHHFLYRTVRTRCKPCWRLKWTYVMGGMVGRLTIYVGLKERHGRDRLTQCHLSAAAKELWTVVRVTEVWLQTLSYACALADAVWRC